MMSVKRKERVVKASKARMLAMVCTHWTVGMWVKNKKLKPTNSVVAPKHAMGQISFWWLFIGELLWLFKIPEFDMIERLNSYPESVNFFHVQLLVLFTVMPYIMNRMFLVLFCFE